MTYEIDPPPTIPSAGDRTEVSPEQLTAQGNRFAALGDDFQRHVTNHPVQPPQLGTAPPARLFAQRLAELTGDTGAAGLGTAWGSGLIGVGDDEQVTATTYADSDADNAGVFRWIGQDR